MKKDWIQQIIPYCIVIIGLLAISYLYFTPVLEGKMVNQADISSYQGASQEANLFREKYDKEPLWTNSMFSGMPTTLIGTRYEGNYLEYIYNSLFVGPRPASYLFLAFLGFFLLMLAMRINVWLSCLGALAFGFCAYNFQIIQAGHNSKMVAIAFMPMVLAALVYAYQHKWLLGSILFSIALSFEIMANHPQITFYLAMIVVGYGIMQLYNAFKEKTFAHFAKTSGALLVAVILAGATNINHLWPTWEYGKYTMRGGSELSMAQSNNTQTKTGLDKEYATAWSYGIEETPNLLIPNFNGGASGGELSKKSKIYETLKQGGVPNADQMIKQMPLYWGPQPFTSGPMYLGAISIFLFVLSLYVVKGSLKWWIATISLLAIFLAWGRHFMWFSNIFFDYVPLYNKFRAPSMTLTILQITVPLLGFYGLHKIFKGEVDKQHVIKGFKISLIITAGFCLLFSLLPSIAGSFIASGDSQYPEWLSQVLPADRESLLRSDAFRSFIFILISAGVIWMGYIKRINVKITFLSLGLLLILDMWTVDKRYLNDSHFVTPREFNNAFTQRPVDKEILQDKDPHYRVLDLAVNTFNDSHSSYHHKTIGGYSAAKLQRYQDLIDYHITPEIQAFASDLRQSENMATVDSSLARLSVLNMLNAKYIITNPNGAPIENKSRLGNAWFVNNLQAVETPDEEILSLKTINPQGTAIIGKDFSHLIKDKNFQPDSSATIVLTSYAPNMLTYKSQTTNEQLAVFSEIYYPKGWKASIDGEPAELLRVNYILRAMAIPAGTHEIKLEYQPDSYYQGAIISKIGSIILILLLIMAIILSNRHSIKHH